MIFMMQIDKQGSGSSPGQPGACRLTCGMHVAREARAPPATGAITAKTVA
ncbi:MAG: hypothetical protein K8G79_00150 [bacterium]|uniref:Uncharacterized protein n=1 Tax=Candidatus Methylomirabilis tolerans TaxID=3123416 RepID=A0AAJ1AFV7_9BACT|nr:hypothetical protein [Candidatus Methylomirabilis sp.]